MFPDPTPKAWLTTQEAARYLRFAGPSSIRAAIRRGWLEPDGRNGPRASYMFRVETLDAYAARWLPPPKSPKPDGKSGEPQPVEPQPVGRKPGECKPVDRKAPPPAAKPVRPPATLPTDYLAALRQAVDSVHKRKGQDDLA